MTLIKRLSANKSSWKRANYQYSFACIEYLVLVPFLVNFKVGKSVLTYCKHICDDLHFEKEELQLQLSNLRLFWLSKVNHFMLRPNSTLRTKSTYYILAVIIPCLCSW